VFAPIAPWIVRCAYRVSVDALQRGLDLRLWVTGRGERRRQGRGSQVRWLPNGLQFHAGRAGVAPRAPRVGARRGGQYVLMIGFVP
jgi:hypothetical protein